MLDATQRLILTKESSRLNFLLLRGIEIEQVLTLNVVLQSVITYAWTNKVYGVIKTGNSVKMFTHESASRLFERPADRAEIGFSNLTHFDLVVVGQDNVVSVDTYTVNTSGFSLV